MSSGCRQATVELVAGLSKPQTRQAAAQAVASRLGAESLLFFVLDPQVGHLIPAPGMPQTIRGGRSWRAFLAGCPKHGRCGGQIELPADSQTHALALVREGTAVVLVGGEPVEDEVAELERLLPLVAALMSAEQDAGIARAAGALAADEARRAATLATALDAARADTAKLNAELREEHRRKDEFLAMLGHELRNPLSPLVNSIALLRRQGTDSGNGPRLLEMMDRQTQQLSRLVDDLLDVSRVSQGKIVLQRKAMPVAQALAGALEESRGTIEMQRHRIEVEGLDSEVMVYGDHARLVQVFGNLLNNAAKYTDPGGSISVRVERKGGNAVVTVKDSGIGISKEMQARIFDLFAQASVALGRAQGGLGIGLTLVRSLVEMHGGRVSVESDGIGAGSAFSVVLPLSLQAQAEARPAPMAAPTRSLRVLIVDDNRDAADSMADLLRMFGHDTEVAYDGESALRLYADRHTDLAILDIGLPDMDGYELARRLRQTPVGQARFVALTGFGTSDTGKKLAEAGFDEHVVKPISADALASLLAETA